VRSGAAVAALPRRDQVVIVACAIGITALAWAYLLHVRGVMSMDMPMPWARADVLFAFVMWSVMMVGMMTTSAIPVLLLFASSQARRPTGGTAFATPLFGLGYLAVWVGFSACAALAQWITHEMMLLWPSTFSARLGGAVLIAAGVYQWTPLKRACLTHCRSPLGFILSSWRDGPLGAFRMGLHHGVYCLGCCWALMGVLFVVGVMNLAWVAALAVFVLLEKMGPGVNGVARLGGVVLIAAGVVLIAGR
jgi:predicted metal-binding membrane protein